MRAPPPNLRAHATRQALLSWLVTRLAAQPARPVLRVAIDGVDGAGKTTLADELARELRAGGRAVIRASTDDFHHPRAVRYRQGRASPQGFYEDSYDLEALHRELLLPLSPGGSLQYRPAVFDVEHDEPVAQPAQTAAAGSLLIVDGLFLHRPELRAFWDDSVFLRVPFEVSVPRGAARGPGYGSPDPCAPSNRRYVQGHRLYFAAATPEAHAGLVLDYTDLQRPAVIHAR
ncbi:uridine kinase [Deinococcus multiflagellatus]|uniref:Uridine kinase n=1 Tax=Deinococcus multiflagellatus TaxID=1656887 RepID=A0ABW1ZM59_9DEIO|nr:uridine kinase [Deinococcus multiflagellatus]MBZ9715208.1 uridine kinase [Deinococcus multiflagellatus]